MNRPLSELQLRAGVLALVSSALRAECIEIARGKSPSAAFDLAAIATRKHGVDVMNTMRVAKATRWLAVIRRDHGSDIFNEAARTLAAVTFCFHDQDQTSADCDRGEGESSMTVTARDMFRFAKALEGAVRGDENIYILKPGNVQGENLPIVGIFQETLPHLDAASQAVLQTWMDGAATFNSNRKDLVTRSKVANQLVTDLATVGINTGVKPPPWRKPPDSIYSVFKVIAYDILLVDLVAYEVGELKHSSDWNAPFFKSEEELIARMAKETNDEGKPRLMILAQPDGPVAAVHGGIQFRILLGPAGKDINLGDLVREDLPLVNEPDAIKRGCVLYATELIVSGQVWREQVLPVFEERYSSGKNGQRFPCRHCDALGRTTPPSLDEPRGKHCEECWGRGFISDLDHRVLSIRRSISEFLAATAGQELKVSQLVGLLSHALEIVRAVEDSIAYRAEILKRMADEDEPFVQPLSELRTWLEAAVGVAGTTSTNVPAVSQEWVRELLGNTTELISSEQEVHWPFRYVQRIDLINRAIYASRGGYDGSKDVLAELIEKIDHKAEELKKLCGWSAFC